MHGALISCCPLLYSQRRLCWEMAHQVLCCRDVTISVKLKTRSRCRAATPFVGKDVCEGAGDVLCTVVTQCTVMAQSLSVGCCKID